MRNCTAWLLRTRRIATDPGARLGAAKAHRTLPPVLRQSQAADVMDAAESGAQQNDPIALRDRLIVELLYATGSGGRTVRPRPRLGGSNVVSCV
nr:hypothetical protein [Rhodococcus jostii]